MRTAVKRKLSIPTLPERIEVLREECEAELDRLAELYRPKGENAVPARAIRNMWMVRGNGMSSTR